ncbi:MAG: alpha/beta fold hydrolase [Pseudonocardia sp.]|uniref:alpha/beta fold hydrolase n=1 Tax=unclassified Pseudonocardia TaxID=2619320 RepID=UPI000869B20A|nr:MULTISPECIES: alpha/beta fold hydrolase [unclassified Pseudonocardia]MBN9110316.1 alpha/beta fold hydrolase [Pseudonocardia sp.]ODV06476.1 MAG: alpha/beta hydrolase [Pseudonocardia sp. SCN 73-27]
MTVVLVHGNPETAAIWGPLVDHLGDEQPTVRLSPPGFGAPVPDGFPATWESYRDWLVTELEELTAGGGQVDLVGHDWGGGHVVNAVMVRPDLVRSWACDVVGIYDPDYVWHDLAQQWQTPQVGEQLVARMGAAPVARRGEGLAAQGMDAAVADKVAAAFDTAMGECILWLYRSAAQPAMADLGAGLEAAARVPGLALVPTDDPYVGTREQKLRAAERAGAHVEELDGLGHWWMMQDPARGAAALTRFWSGI